MNMSIDAGTGTAGISAVMPKFCQMGKKDFKKYTKFFFIAKTIFFRATPLNIS